MRPLVLFRADSSSTIGTGHIMRDLVLAKRDFKEWRVVFATRELPGQIDHKIEAADYEVVKFPDGKWESFLELVAKLRPQAIVIDHYGIGYEEERVFKERFPDITLMVLDDTYRRHHCDILLNHNVYADTKRYEGLVPERCELRCGEAYTLIREEFHRAKREKKTPGDGPFRVLLAMGGADTAQLNLPILEMLESFEDIEAHVVTTSANRHLDALQAWTEKRPWGHLHIETDAMARLMAQSDLVIATPSVTMNEVLFMEVPFVAVEVADNQKEMGAYLRKRGYWVMEGFDASILQNLIMQELRCSKVSLTPFTALDPQESELVRSWRNDPRVRQWMLNEEIITPQQHRRFVESLAEEESKRYFLVQEGEEAVGVIDFTGIDLEARRCEIGLYADPDRHGLGNLLMETILRYAKKVWPDFTLVAEVFEGNEKAIHLYERFGFEKRGQKEYNGRRLIVMERRL
ncbi:UDP-2,4-diacetamido-2,4,6-trideoxy-beta-L-altropyranose hydrolase [Nitratifractor sp.]